ncbi:class I SAM-dependent methyltransferase [Aestuariibacter sp. AA17]|uniref:Class I SAM-dependent methyltransferase n=1 Tax=Fluctibacter corallii TaxID=2984329 RepID=A0ABT3AD43_9ALTE|nr:class I SAM-dependent methyltransferase [Aestuariibacter sp. AA17]MCV2886554.1 class I SAM-dependent methyltransferase [Aestuariibacter sp. AA17]
MLNYPCPLCLSGDTQHYHTDKRRRYFQCNLCMLVFVEPCSLPNQVQEKQEYDLHENAFEDEGYRHFLTKLSAPLIQTLSENLSSPTLSGLDFGCGPAPVLASMLEEFGIKMAVFDPIYANNLSKLRQRYDVITCTEACEHFHAPHVEFTKLINMLTPNGLLAVMTKRVISKERFAHWHYKNDITHVSFFSEKTFQWIANHYGLTLSVISNDVVFLRKHINSPT